MRQVPEQRITFLDASDRGLTAAEVAERRGAYGRNAIIEASSRGWLDILRSTGTDPMIWFLIATAGLFTWLGDYTEAAVLAAALLPIAGMDAYLHRRTQASAEGLSSRIAALARVYRDGALIEIAAEDLVPGDLAVVSSGSYFPADGLIIAGAALQADESTLTGEALPVAKQVLEPPLPDGVDVPVENIYWGLAGTRLLTGEATVRIIATGAETLYGEIARLSTSSRAERTPLQEAIGGLVKILMVIALVLCAVLAIVRYVQGYGLVDAALSALTLAIAALPEEFPVVFSFFLGVGVYRLAKSQALVRRAVVVENIGRVTCICTDKTGTLTEGKLALSDLMPCEGIDRKTLLHLAATAARAESGDPLDLLLRDAAEMPVAVPHAVFPFTEDRRREVVVVKQAADFLIAMKGAPETVLQMSNLDETACNLWRQRTQDLAALGCKVIAVASLRQPAWSGEEPEHGFTFAGLLAFTDPVRPSVAAAVASAQGAGIRIIMITGDHAQTAAAIASQAGIGGPDPCVVDGTEMSARLASGADISDIDVVARCLPSQKLDLVLALQRDGEIVAVTGDGVNDAPALRGADVGIAMGERGTRSAREVASIVLLDDDFGTIIRAIAEGRQLFLNLKLSFAYLLMIHAPLVLTAALIPMLGYPLLYLPVHIVWLELIIHPTALLVFQASAATGPLAVMPRRSRVRFFSGREWSIIGFVGLLTSLMIFWGYVISLGPDADVPHARTMALVALIVAGATMTAVLSGLKTHQAKIAVAATIGSVIVAAQITPIASLLHLSPLHLLDWAFVVAVGLGVGAVATLMRHVSRDGIKPGHHAGTS